MKMKKSDLLKFVGLLAFLAIVTIIVVLLWPHLKGMFEPGGVQNLIERIREAGPVGVFVLLGFQLLQVIVALIPGEVVQIAAGLLYGPWLGVLILFVGCVISSFIVFQLVHRLGAPFVRDIVPDRLIDRFDTFEKTKKFDIIVFILFLIPGLPKDVFTYIVPLTEMPMGKYLIISNIARLPGMLGSTLAASALISGDYLKAGIIFGVLAVIAIVVILLSERLLEFLEHRFKHESKTSGHEDSAEEAGPLP